MIILVLLYKKMIFTICLFHVLLYFPMYLLAVFLIINLSPSKKNILHPYLPITATSHPLHPPTMTTSLCPQGDHCGQVRLCLPTIMCDVFLWLVMLLLLLLSLFSLLWLLSLMVFFVVFLQCVVFVVVSVIMDGC